MANPRRQLLVGIIDTSGSMYPHTEATQRGWGDLVSEQGTVEGFQTFTSLYTFNSRVKTHHEMREWGEEQPFIMHAAGTTALLDAIVHGIDRTGDLFYALPEHDRPGNITVGIFTDGMENASDPNTTYAGVQGLIGRKRSLGWKFSFAGANMDAIQVASTLGIGAETSVTYNVSNVRETFTALSAMNTRGLVSGVYAYNQEERRSVQ